MLWNYYLFGACHCCTKDGAIIGWVSLLTHGGVWIPGIEVVGETGEDLVEDDGKKVGDEAGEEAGKEEHGVVMWVHGELPLCALSMVYRVFPSNGIPCPHGYVEKGRDHRHSLVLPHPINKDDFVAM